MRIALFRPLGLADVLCAVPALRALDAAYPESRITLIGLPSSSEIATRLHRYVDEFSAFPGFPGIPGECDVEAVPDFFAKMKKQRFDLAVQMHGAGEIANPLMVLMGAAENAGFYRPGRYCPDARRYLPWDDEEDDVQRWLRLTAHLGALVVSSDPARSVIAAALRTPTARLFTDLRQTLREARQLLDRSSSAGTGPAG